jgi:hypothetical protein
MGGRACDPEIAAEVVSRVAEILDQAWSSHDSQGIADAIRKIYAQVPPYRTPGGSALDRSEFYIARLRLENGARKLFTLLRDRAALLEVEQRIRAIGEDMKQMTYGYEMDGRDDLPTS